MGMQKLMTLCPAWVMLPFYERDYRQLLLRSYVLVVRARVLECAVILAMPFATVGLVALLRRQSDALAADTVIFRRHVREWRRAMSGIPTGEMIDP
jgi:hypothetical protein